MLHLGAIGTVRKKAWAKETLLHKKWQATYITLLRPYTLAVFPPWGIKQELVV